MIRLLATWREPGEVAVRSAWERKAKGGSLLDSIESGLAAAELDPEFIAIGLGSLPNADGELELDASVMIGKTLEAGAVCSVRGIVPVISLARKVMEKTEHVMLAGDQARRFAIEQGMAPRNLMTDRAIEHYEKWRTDPERAWKYVHSVSDISHDTVTMIGIENGELIAASSTSGMPYKLPGRVGDSPIVGAGIYADDEVGAAGATGLGEELWKAAASFRVVEFMRQGLSAQEACEATVRQMIRRQPRASEIMCVVFGMDKAGNFGASTTLGEFVLWSCTDGAVESHTYGPPTS